MPKVGGKVPTRTYGQIIEFELIEDIKKLHKPKKHCVYQVDVTWTDSTVRRVYRSYDQIHEFYCSLCGIIKDGGMVKLAGKRTFERSTTESFAVKHMYEIRMFVDSLLRLPAFLQQSDLFLWFWEPTGEDIKIFDIDRTLENNSKYPIPSATVLRGGTVLVDEDDGQDYICVCTALNCFDGNMPAENTDLRGLSIKEGDVIYVLRMSNCPAGYWLVRNVFGSEGMVPITSVRVDQDILQRKKRRSLRVQQKRFEMVKSAENLAERSLRVQQHKRLEMIKSAENISDRWRSRRAAGPFSPPMSRTLRDINYNYVEPSNRRRSNRPPAYNDSVTSSVPGDRQVTQDLIKSLHETSIMLQERMVMSEMELQRRRLFEDFNMPTRPRRTETHSAESRPRQSRQFDSARSSSAAYFVRSPTKRGVRVSARFKRMSPSPTKFISPCRKGIKGLRIAAPSPLAAVGPSPSQNITFDKSPSTGAGRKRTATSEVSPSKKSCLDIDDSGHGCSGKEDLIEAVTKPRRRSDIARRVSLRLKQVYGKEGGWAKSPKSRVKKRVVSNGRAV